MCEFKACVCVIAECIFGCSGDKHAKILNNLKGVKWAFVSYLPNQIEWTLSYWVWVCVTSIRERHRKKTLTQNRSSDGHQKSILCEGVKLSQFIYFPSNRHLSQTLFLQITFVPLLKNLRHRYSWCDKNLVHWYLAYSTHNWVSKVRLLLLVEKYWTSYISSEMAHFDWFIFSGWISDNNIYHFNRTYLLVLSNYNLQTRFPLEDGPKFCKYMCPFKLGSSCVNLSLTVKNIFNGQSFNFCCLSVFVFGYFF